MSVVFQKAYSYSLFNYDDSWYLTYLTGGPMEVGISVHLTKDEIALVSSDQTALESLIKKFKADSSLYKGRRIVPSVTSKGPPKL